MIRARLTPSFLLILGGNIMKKRILSHVLTLCLMLALMPTIALADDLTELYIGSNTAVTLPDNGKYTYGDNAGGAGIPANTLAEIPENATWYLYRNDSASPKYTLTLNGVSIPATANWTSSLDVNIFSSAMCARRRFIHCACGRKHLCGGRWSVGKLWNML